MILQETEDFNYVMNVNHIVAATSFIVKDEAKIGNNVGIFEFCKNNLIFKFIQYLDYPLMYNFIKNILGITN